jgi:hypothetical protein
VASRAELLCEYCLIHESDTYLGCQVDHIISEKHGGPTGPANLAFACAWCNRAKGSDIASLTARTKRLVRLFNPRTDRWSDHFQLVGSWIEWHTAVGEVTVRLLQLNDLHRLQEREALRATGRYPRPAAARRISGT